MDEIQDKLERLTNAILNESHTVTERILSEIEHQRDAALEASEAELKLEVLHYKRAKIAELKSEQSRRVTGITVENRRELFRLRDEYAHQVFELLRDRIAEFTKTPAYLDKLKQYLCRGISEIGGGSALVLLRREDMKFVDELKDCAEGSTLSFSEGKFELGGLMLSSLENNMNIDMTYDTEFSELDGHFAEMFGLELE